MQQNMGFHRWGNCYKQIRQANIFLANAKPIAANAPTSMF